MSYPKESVNGAFIRCGELHVEDVARIMDTTPAEVEAAVGSSEDRHKSLNTKGLVKLHSSIGGLLSAYDSGEEEREQKEQANASRQRLSAKIRRPKRSIGKFLEDTARRAVAANKAKTVGNKARQAGENLRAKKAGLPPPHQAPETSAAARPPHQAPETSAAASSSNGAEQAPKKRPRCTTATLVQPGGFIDSMEHILESHHATRTDANLLKKALAASCASLRVEWQEATSTKGYNGSFGEFLYSYVSQTKNLGHMERVALGASLIQQQQECTSGPVD
jgi:hypothetical protein